LRAGKAGRKAMRQKGTLGSEKKTPCGSKETGNILVGKKEGKSSTGAQRVHDRRIKSTKKYRDCLLSARSEKKGKEKGVDIVKEERGDGLVQRTVQKGSLNLASYPKKKSLSGKKKSPTGYQGSILSKLREKRKTPQGGKRRRENDTPITTREDQNEPAETRKNSTSPSRIKKPA